MSDTSRSLAVKRPQFNSHAYFQPLLLSLFLSCMSNTYTPSPDRLLLACLLAHAGGYSKLLKDPVLLFLWPQLHWGDDWNIFVQMCQFLALLMTIDRHYSWRSRLILFSFRSALERFLFILLFNMRCCIPRLTSCHPHWQRANILVAQFVNIFGRSTGYKPASQLVCCILKRLKIFSARSPENDAFVGAAPSKTANVAYYKVRRLGEMDLKARKFYWNQS